MPEPDTFGRNADSFTGADLDRTRLDAAASAVEAHPGFAEALPLFCGSVIAAFEASRMANRLMGQAGRFAMLALILALDAEHRAGRHPAGATGTELARALGRRKLASAGRVRAMLDFLRTARMIEPAELGEDGRQRRIRPTPLLVEQAGRWLESSLAPAALVTALPATIGELMRREGFVEQFFVHMVAPFLREGFILYDGFPEIERLMQRTGGYVLMIEILRTVTRTASGITIADVPPDSFATRMAVSRAQVRSILNFAARQNWLLRANRTVELDPRFAARLRHWVATELAWGGDLARRAYATSGA